MDSYIGAYCLMRNENGDVMAGKVLNMEFCAKLCVVHLEDGTILRQWSKHPKGSLTLAAVSQHGGGPDSKVDVPVHRCMCVGVRQLFICSKEAEKWLRTPLNYK